MMGDVIGVMIFAGLIGLFVYNAQGCANRQIEEQLIKNKGFCVHAESTGQKFKKCYELREKAGE